MLRYSKGEYTVLFDFELISGIDLQPIALGKMSYTMLEHLVQHIILNMFFTQWQEILPQNGTFCIAHVVLI
jgi:hypothetical protein